MTMAAIFVLAPSGQADNGEDANALGSCGFIIVDGTASCQFTCTREATVSVEFSGDGTVTGVCAGPNVATCVALGHCESESFTRNVVGGRGVCTLSGTGSGSCSSP